MLQSKITPSIRVESCQTGDSLIGNVPAGSQIKTFELFETPGDKQQTRISHVAAATQIEFVQMAQMLSQTTKTRVRYLLTQAQVQASQCQDVRRYGMSDTCCNS